MEVRSIAVAFAVLLLSFGPAQATSLPSSTGAVPPLQTPSEPSTLEAGKPIGRELAGGQAHAYQLALSPGQYLHVVVDQRAIDVTVVLFGPDGRRLAEVDNPNRR